MKLVVISSAEESPDEIKLVHEMFGLGMEYLHLRKPGYSTSRMEKYLESVDDQYLNRVIIHSHHELALRYKIGGIHLTQHHRKKKYWRSWLLQKYVRFRKSKLLVTTGFHTLGALKEEEDLYDYVFLSPVFDSISKVGYRNTFNLQSLSETLAESRHHVMALGGVNEERIGQARSLGFYGVAVHGGMWRFSDPVKKFSQIKLLCEQE